MSNNDKTKQITDEELKEVQKEANTDATVVLSDTDIKKATTDVQVAENKPAKKPEQNKDKKKVKEKDRPSKFGYAWKLIKIFTILLTLIIVALGIYALYYFYNIYNSEEVQTQVNDSTFYKSKQSNKIYDINGDFVTALTLNYVDWVELDEIPDYYIDGLIATEDANFYEHEGVDYYALAKGVVYEKVLHKSRGGSTITMQLGKILYMEDWYLPDENGVVKSSQNEIEYKLTQMAYALEIEQHYSKDEILDNYINSVNYGGAYGIENASKYYFGKSAKDLTISESALLIGLPQSPSYYDPFDNPENAKAVRDEVLGAMLKEGVITQEQYDEESNVEIASLLTDTQFVPNDIEEAFVPYLDIVQRQLDDKLSEIAVDEDGEDIATTGLTVHTYLDPDLQRTNYTDGSTNSSDVRFQDEYIQNGMVQMDTYTGAVYSVVNGRGERGRGGTNFAYNYTRQPGSTAKPIVDYGPAIEFLQWSSYHPVEDKAITYRDGGASVQNSSGSYAGYKPIQYHIAVSSNTPALRTFYEVVDNAGRDKIGEFMFGLGITDIPVTGVTDDEGNEVKYLAQLDEIDYSTDYDLYPYDAYSIGGWSIGTTPMEMAGAYAAFGNGGTYNEPHTINYISFDETSALYDKFGEKYEYEYASRQAMKPETAYIMSKMLDVDYVDAASLAGSAANGPTSYDAGHYGQSVPELSAKTGTTNWDKSTATIAAGTQRDRWVVGYSPNVTTAVWTGYETEYEEKGYYPAFGQGYYGNDALELFHVYTWNAEDSGGAHLHDSKYQAQPANVSVQYLVRNSTNRASGSQPYYFVTGSSDETESFGLDTPTITDSSTSGDSVNIKWSEVDNAKEYNVYIDGKLYKTQSGTSISIPNSDFASTSTCKATYNVTVSADGDRGESEQSGAVKVDFKNDEFCNPPEENEGSDE